GALVYHSHIRVTINLSYPRGRTPAEVGEEIPEATFDSVLKNYILNYDSARNWRMRPRLSTQPPARERVNRTAPFVPPVPGSWYKISLNQDGLYLVTCPTLQAAGVNLSDPTTLRVFKNNLEMPISLAGNMPGSCGPNDGVEFYGLATTTPFTTTNVYWLTSGSAPGLRMAAIDGTPGSGTTPTSFVASKHLEQDLFYIPRVPSTDKADHWFWDYLAGNSQNYTFTLNLVSSDTVTPSLQYALQGFTTGGHHSQVRLNGALIDDQTWSGSIPFTRSVAVTQSLYTTGVNTLTVSNLGDPLFDQFYINSFDVRYAHTFNAESDRLVFGGDNPGTWQYQVGNFLTNTIELFDITNPYSLTRYVSTTIAGGGPYELRFHDTNSVPRHFLALTPAQRLVPLSVAPYSPANLASPGNGADYILITRGDLITATQPLAALRTARGLRTKLVNVQDIYDEFNDGVLSPFAIRDFLSYTYSYWQAPAPTYVVLVGDGTYDFKNNLGLNADTVIPPFLAMVDPFNGEADADNRYVAFNGAPYYLPQMLLGRLPAKNPAETTNMVDKIINYENALPSGPWRRNVVFVSDNTPDAAGDFQAQSEDIVKNHLPATYNPIKLYMNNICGPNPSQGDTTPCPAENFAITNTINVTGALFVQWVGHGSWVYWAHEKVYGTYPGNYLATLNNGPRLPIMLPWTCYIGNFIYPYPNNEAVAESELRLVNAGSIASFSPTGADIDTGHHYLNIGFFDYTFNNPAPVLGLATQAAKLNLYTHSGGSYLGLVDTYLLFGDPALRIAIPRPNWLPVILNR
ncbi:MAG TPA: C25 family cysteine peptidase, partial [Anaerolineae bacterium]